MLDLVCGKHRGRQRLHHFPSEVQRCYARKFVPGEVRPREDVELVPKVPYPPKCRAEGTAEAGDVGQSAVAGEDIGHGSSGML